MGTDTSAAELVCSVCGGAGLAAMTAECNWCDQRFHLNQRNDIEAKDCGQVWVDEQYMALQFACDRCLAGTPQIRESLTTPPISISDGAPARARRYKRRA